MKVKKQKSDFKGPPGKKNSKKTGNFHKKNNSKFTKNKTKNNSKQNKGKAAKFNKSKNNAEKLTTPKPEKSDNNENTEKIPKYEKFKPKNKSNSLYQQNNAKFSKKGKPNLDMKKYRKGEKQDTTGEKPNWLEYKKQQKDLREKRRARKLEGTYDIAVQAKQLGEKLRNLKLAPDSKEKLTKKFHNLVQNQYAKLIFAHDLSRVIQWQIKYCNADIQLSIVEELKPHLREMFYSKYAKNVIRTLLKKGSDNVKKCILQACYGEVVKLLGSVVSAPLFEKIYVETASDAEKNAFKQEFYGDIYKKSKDPNIKTLTDVYKDSESMKAATLSAVKANLTKILNKNLINSTLVHTVLYEFLSNCSKEDRDEILALVRPLISELSQTKDGAKAGNLCIWYGTNKDRKLIMKTLKEHIKDIITSEHGYLMILGLLDSIDDTVLLKKILLQEVLNNLKEIALNEYGRRVILYLVARRDTKYFHPALINYLKEGDENPTSKKPAEIREKELLANVIDNLLENITTDVKTWLLNGPIQLVTFAILKASYGDKPKAVFEAIAQFITDPNAKIQKDEKTFEAIEEPGLHMILKKLIRLDSERLKKSEITFSEVLIKYLTDDVIEHWTKYNRGCFLLVTLLENELEAVSELKSKLRKIKKIKSKQSKGATVLLSKL